MSHQDPAPSPGSESRLTELTQRHIDGLLTPPEASEFGELLASSPEAAASFAAAMRLDATITRTMRLDSEAAVPSGTPESPQVSAEGAPIYRKGHEPSPKSETRIPKSAVALSLAAALLAACGLAAYFLVFNTDPSDIEHRPSNIEHPPLATLIESTPGSQLTTPGGFISEGRDYPRGEYTLSSGTAEFMLTNSVNVKLRGDTRMVMRNDMNVSLVRGSAEFVVPKDATGFAVQFPGGARVVDLGTSFTVEVAPDGGPTEVRVRDGEVDLRGLDGYPDRSLLAGHIASIDASGALRSIKHELHHVSPLAGPGGNTVNLADGLSMTWSNDNANAGNSRINTDNRWGTPPVQQSDDLPMPRPLIWEAAPEENAPAIRTTVGDLPEGTYEVFVLWMNSSATPRRIDWNIRAKLSDAADYQTLSAPRDATEIVKAPHLFRRALGKVTGTAISVDIDDTPGDRQRSRYIGIAYRRVIEPPAAVTATLDTTDSTNRHHTQQEQTQ